MSEPCETAGEGTSLPLRGLQAMVTYVQSGLAQPGDTMFEDIARRLAQRAAEERGESPA